MTAYHKHTNAEQKLCCSISPISSAFYNINKIGPIPNPQELRRQAAQRVTWACHGEHTASGHGDRNGTMPKLVHPDWKSAAAACTGCYGRQCQRQRTNQKDQSGNIPAVNCLQ